MPTRSTNPDDYQDLPVPVAVMQKVFAPDWTIAPHHHRRDQLIYAVSGTMRVRTETHSWVVPPQRAVYMPSGMTHAVSMRGRVEMRTLYIEPNAHHDLPRDCVVILPSPLLSALIEALLEEPAAYAGESRGAWMAQLILDEIRRGRELSLSIPMPQDGRLCRVCEYVLEHPEDDRSLDGHAEQSGASARTLARLCTAELGMSFSAWRQQVRFHYAVEALARGEPVGAVAHACGYASPSAFTAAFRKSFGQPPSQLLL